MEIKMQLKLQRKKVAKKTNAEKKDSEKIKIQ